MLGKLDGHSYAGTPKNFQTTHIGYRAHRGHLCDSMASCFFLVATNDSIVLFGDTEMTQTTQWKLTADDFIDLVRN